MKAYRIVVRGLVQGVGFRPFVVRLAKRMGAKGWVRNVAGGAVEIHLEGVQPELFIRELETRKPWPAIIEKVEIVETVYRGCRDFIILKSERNTLRSQIPRDVAICEKCLKEVLNPFSRRFRWALNSCAYCGPRFSILYSLPYDRENTSMSPFPLCAECEREYRDIKDRRFHAQGISCPKCGPRVRLLDSDGKTVITSDPTREAAKLIDEGFIVAIKGMGGYHLAARADVDEPVIELRRRKRRKRKPFAIMALNEGVASELVELKDGDLNNPEAPIVLLPMKEGAEVSPHVAPGHKLLGVMVAYTALHYLILRETKKKYSIMTSANPTGKPMCTNLDCVLNLKVADYVVEHDRKIVNRVDDSVVRYTASRRVLIRRSRGFAPLWIELPVEGELSAYGAELQNAGGVMFSNKAILTQYIGDTDDLDTAKELDYYIKWFERTYSLKPKAIVVDLHPNYLSKKIALKRANEEGIEVIEVQHHHAHVVSAMVDYGVTEGVGIAVDGLGYGVDGNIWGGEVLKANLKGFERVGHLKYVPMPGGDRATKYPGRMLISYLSQFMSDDELKGLGLEKYLPYGKTELEITIKQLKGSVQTSSTGRALDAMSTLLGISWERSYEGEPAMLLEAYSLGGEILSFPEVVRLQDGVYIVDVPALFEWALDALKKHKKRDVAATFQYAIGYSLGLIASYYSDEVFVSGGAAVNEFIVRGIEGAVGKVKLPRRVPAGDGGIALGQLAIGAAHLS